MRCYRAELEVDLRSRWTEFINVPLSYAHLYGTDECIRDAYHKERRESHDKRGSHKRT